LRQRGSQINEHEVGYLYERYQVSLGCADRLDSQRLQKIVAFHHNAYFDKKGN
jgi:hypothetical protein